MTWILIIASFFVIVIIILLNMPYSLTKACFNKDINFHINRITRKDMKITEQDIKALPEPVQNYFRVSKHLGKERMRFVKVHINSAPLNLTYDEYDLLKRREKMNKVKPKKITNFVFNSLVIIVTIVTIIRWIYAFNNNVFVMNTEINSHISNFSLSLLFIWGLVILGCFKE